MTPWSFFTQIRKAANVSHGIDLHISFAAPLIPRECAVLGVHFFHGGNTAVIQLNERSRSMLDFTWLHFPSHPNSSLLNVSDGRSGRQQWVIVGRMDNGTVRISVVFPRSEFTLADRHMRDYPPVADEITPATSSEPRYIMCVDGDGGRRKAYYTSGCFVPSDESNFALHDFAPRKGESVRLTFHTAQDLATLQDSALWWVYVDGEPRQDHGSRRRSWRSVEQ